MPTPQFFELTGIKRGRWWQLYRGERIITEKEYKAVCDHLQVDRKTAMNIRQLELFDTCTTVK